MKTKKLWSMLAMMMALVLSVGFASCDEKDDPELTVNKTSLSLQANGDGDKDIIVTASNTDWSVSVTEGSSWLSVNKNGQYASVSVSENTTANKRDGKFNISATADSKLSYTITVSQAGAAGIISVTPSNVEFEAEGGTQTIQVTSNSGWGVSGIPGWLTVSPSSGNTPNNGTETKSVTMSALENPTKDARPCNIVFTTTDGKASTTVSVTQKKQSPYILVNGLESTSLSFASGSGVTYKQTVKVSSNVSWSISFVPDWLSVSPKNGNGELNIEIYPTSDNNVSSSRRETQLVLSSGATSATINISQTSDLEPDVLVTPTNIITLYNGIAFDYKFGNKVSYYYRGYMEKSAVASMTDNEVIKVLEENFNRYTPGDDEVASFSGLDEGTTYMVYTVGYNKDGKRGELTKTEVSTKTLQNNEPLAWISNPTNDGSYWHWNIEKSAACYSYYMLSTEDLDFALADDVFQAWMINYYIRQNWITEYVNGGTWRMEKEGSIIAIMTWGLDKKENFASRISWNIGFEDSSSSPKKVKKSPSNEVSDKNYSIIKKEKLTIFKKQ